MVKTKIYNLKERKIVANVNGDLEAALLKMDGCIAVEFNTKMDIKATLKAYNDMQNAKEIISKKLEAELNRRIGLQAANNDGLPHTTGTSDPVMKKTQFLLNQDAAIKKLKVDLARIENDILVCDILLDQLTSVEKKIIDYYYIKQNYSWEKIAALIHYSRSECIRKRDSALKKMYEFLFSL